jgi:hypothetical protein
VFLLNYSISTKQDSSKALSAIQEGIASLTQQLSASNLGMTGILDMSHITDHLEGTRRERIFKWLSAPDPLSTHITSRRNCQPHTGQWFVKGNQFKQWRESPNSFLWIYGIRRFSNPYMQIYILSQLLSWMW